MLSFQGPIRKRKGGGGARRKRPKDACQKNQVTKHLSHQGQLQRGPLGKL